MPHVPRTAAFPAVARLSGYQVFEMKAAPYTPTKRENAGIVTPCEVGETNVDTIACRARAQTLRSCDGKYRGSSPSAAAKPKMTVSEMTRRAAADP